MFSSGPQFATVSFLLESGAEGGVFRVPITDGTTVRRLAKDAMQRLLARRGDGRLPFTPETISVSSVFVGDGSQKAEIFAQDLVAQVVLVKEEVVYMRLHLKNPPSPAKETQHGVPTPKTQPTPPLPPQTPPHATQPEVKPPPHAQTAPKEALEEPPAAACGGARQRSASPNALTAPERSPKRTPLRAETHTTAKAAESVVMVDNEMEEESVADAAALGRSKRPREDSAQTETHETHAAPRRSARLGWGPEAHKHFADNYVSSPNKLMRRRASAPEKAEDPPAKAAEPKTRKRKTEKADAEGGGAIQTQPLGRASRLGWGPEAHKHFADNYVSSPDKLARAIRHAKRRMAEEKAAEPPTVPAAGRAAQSPIESETKTRSAPLVAHSPHAVERRLSYGAPMGGAEESDRTPTGRATVEDEARPTGWGKEAARFFDPETYCDNPNKARLSAEVLARPVRARRDVVLPAYFSVLDK